MARKNRGLGCVCAFGARAKRRPGRPYTIRQVATVTTGLRPYTARTGITTGFIEADGSILRPFIGFERDVRGKGEHYEDITSEREMEQAGLHDFGYQFEGSDVTQGWPESMSVPASAMHGCRCGSRRR